MIYSSQKRTRPRVSPFALLALFASLSVGAQELTQYEVEVVVFRHTQPATDGELWERPLMPGDEQDMAALPIVEPEMDTADEEDAPLTAETIPTGEFELLPAERFQLADAVAKLSNASRFSPLVHTGWSQPAVIIAESTAKSLAGSDSASQVTGRVVLSRGRYLHLDFDLTLTAEGADYHLRQSRRRLQTGRFHYIDHPMFSAIAIVSRAPAADNE